MLRTFNCGLGMIAVVNPGQLEAVITAFEKEGQFALEIGKIVAGEGEAAVHYTKSLAL
jgi:phosphoribosylformylglycinamidine cyclo-ligase